LPLRRLSCCRVLPVRSPGALSLIQRDAGWTSAWRDAERPCIARRYADLPTLGRLTGRGNAANVEVVLQARPDVILDLARLLYPDALPEDLRPVVRDFNTRCFHQAPSEAQLDQLLDAR